MKMTLLEENIYNLSNNLKTYTCHFYNSESFIRIKYDVLYLCIANNLL